MSNSQFFSYLLNNYIQQSGCRECLLYYERTPCILPVSTKASGCGMDHVPYFFGATFPHLFATSRKEKEGVTDPCLNSFFKLCSKTPEPDPQLDQFYSWATAPSGLVSFILSLLKCIFLIFEELGKSQTT